MKVGTLREGSDSGNGDWLAPACAAIVGGESHDSRLVCVTEGDNHRAVGLNKRFSIKAGGPVHGRSGSPPCPAAISGCTHLDQVAPGGVIPFSVAMSIVSAGRCVVTNNPILVEIAIAPNICNRYRVTPVYSVRREAG